ncbi:MAG: protein kinase [Gemmatimonadaceae bacterium]
MPCASGVVSLFDWLRPADPPDGRSTSRTRACPHCSTALPGAARFCFVCGREVDVSAYEPPRKRGGGPFADLQSRLAHTLDGRYLVRDVLGAGGMGVVFLADDLALDRAVAIKVLPPEVSGDPTVVSRFRREAKTAARLDHPGIIPIYRVENEGGLDYFIMKYVAGRSLEAVLHDHTQLPVDVATRILREASAALAHAHRHGVVHRDVKPANIMLDADERVILTDFGISKASSAASADDATTEPRLTELGTAIGTPQYMAPEQAVGNAVDGRADQYALAIVGFEMLAGRVPFDDETPHAIVHRQISEAPPDLAALRPDAPRHIVATIGRALRKSPASRFASMDEFAAALDDPTMSTMTPAHTRRITAGGQGTPTRVLPADDRELDTALDRVFDPDAQHPRGGGRRIPWLAVLLLLIFGLGAAAVASGRLTLPRRIAPRVGRAATKSPVAPTPSPARETTPPRAKDNGRRTAQLSVISVPRATVFIDGARVGETPITGRTLTVGRTYRIRVERKGYRTKSDRVTATGTRPLLRSYVLERVRQR